MINNYKERFVCIVGAFDDKDAEQKYAQAERELVNAGFQPDKIFNPAKIFSSCPKLSIYAKVGLVIDFLELSMSAYLIGPVEDASKYTYDYAKTLNYIFSCNPENRIKTFTNVNEIS